MSEKEIPLGYGQHNLSLCPNSWRDLPRSSKDEDMSYEHRRGKETQKYIRKSGYHRIKCTVTTFLAVFMWRKHLNSEVLATTTHKKPGDVFDGTCTQVISQMVNKCRAKLINRDCSNLIYNCTQSELIYMNVKLLGLGTYSYLCLKFNSNCL